MRCVDLETATSIESDTASLLISHSNDIAIDFYKAVRIDETCYHLEACVENSEKRVKVWQDPDAASLQDGSGLELAP